MNRFLLLVIFTSLLSLSDFGTIVAEDTLSSRGYLTTPQELHIIAQKAQAEIEPYFSAVAETLDWADRSWNADIESEVECHNADRPRWVDRSRTGITYAKALAFHLTGDERYAAEVKIIIESIIARVDTISIEDQQCRLNFAWSMPEYIAAADLIEDYWRDMTCYGPTTAIYGDTTRSTGNCKQLFQNWLVKNPYYAISQSTFAQSNWGAAATNAAAYIADYLWDRPDLTLIHRYPPKINEGAEVALSPAEAYEFATQLLFDRLNGYGVEVDSSSSCDFLDGRQQDDDYAPVKSQITERGIIPEDARREQRCNIPEYNGRYQNYPQVHLNNTLQQCELMLRRGDSSCYDNIDNEEIPEYRFIGPDGEEKVTHLYAGRGSIERAINAIIIDSDTEWRHDNGLFLAYHYYLNNSRFGLVSTWYEELGGEADCSQGVCFGKLTHGFTEDETPALPPTVPPPGN